VVSSGSVSDLQQDEQPFLKERRMNKNSPPEGKKSYHPRQKNESQGKIWETHFTTTFYVPYRHSLPNSTARRTNLTPCLSLKLSQPERCRGDPRAAGLRDRRNMTGRSSPRTGPIKRPCLLRLLKNDWPKKKRGIRRHTSWSQSTTAKSDRRSTRRASTGRNSSEEAVGCTWVAASHTATDTHP
jgi:hypothetical protein